MKPMPSLTNNVQPLLTLTNFKIPKPLNILYPRIFATLMTIPYEKGIGAYEKLTSAYDVFGILAKHHNHVSLSNSFVVSETYFLQGLRIQ